jgi:ketosteroid isomerase-like protein
MTPSGIIMDWQKLGGEVGYKEATEKWFAEDAKLYVTGTGWIIGRPAIIEHLTEVTGRYRTMEAQNSHWVTEGDRVAHRFHWHSNTYDGRILDLEVFNLCRLANGKVVSVEEFYDPNDRYQQLFG